MTYKNFDDLIYIAFNQLHLSTRPPPSPHQDYWTSVLWNVLQFPAVGMLPHTPGAGDIASLSRNTGLCPVSLFLSFKTQLRH